MKILKRLKQILVLSVIVWLSLSVVGCTQADLASSANPIGAESDPESSLNIGSTTGKAANKAPVINLSLQRTSIGTDSELTLTAQALDPDGDQINFDWSSSDGVFVSNAGSSVVWRSPEVPTVASISCKVSDSKGAETIAYATIEVVGNSVYKLIVTADKTSLVASSITSNDNQFFVPLPGARVELVNSGEIGVTDSNGVVEFNINQTNAVATLTVVNIKCFDWDISYNATLKPAVGSKVIDYINFYPGYDGVSVAVGKGDSFVIKRGAVEVSTIEDVYGERKTVPEVTVDVGSAQKISDIKFGVALVPSPTVSNGNVNLRLTKTGYKTIDGYKIPITPDGVTLVRAKIEKANFSPSSTAILAWTKPYKSQKAFPVNGPFELGFGQAMEKETIFNDVSIMIQNKETGNMISLDGQGIKNNFRIKWVGDTVLQLYPLRPLSPLTKYSLLISQWTARAADGRIVKNYNGMYGEFYTDADPEPSIISTSPVNGDVSVGRTGPFIANFDRPMNPESLLQKLKIEITNLDSGSKIVLDGSSVKSHFSITWTNKNTTLELVPYRMLQANKSYLIKVLSCNLESTTGKSVKGISNLWGQFTTGGL